MRNEETLNKLKTMRLTGMAEAYELHTEDKDINNLSFAIINFAFLFNFNFSFGINAIQIYNNTATVIACIINIPKNSLVGIL